jgi:hypothetical protein
MKIIFWVMGLLAVIYFMSVFTQSTKAVDGSNQRTAANSVKKLKRYMSTQQQHIFETSYGVLGAIKSKEGPDAFLPFVDGKTPDEVVELAREAVNARIAAGDPDFVKYESWDNLVGLGMEGTSRSSGGKAVPLQPLRNSVRSGRDEAAPAEAPVSPVPAVAPAPAH